MKCSIEIARHRRGLYAQLFLLAVVWLYVAMLHADNDGLWYQGDAPRHAANGLFWKDLFAMQPSDPVQFATAYYFRYPVIHPSSHPPGLHLLEALGYSIWGPSPFVGKTIVLTFLLLGSAYLLAWLRRWFSPEAGWAAPLLLLQPGTVAWSHVILLNVPAMAISVASLYHARRWMESARSGHLYGFGTWGLVGLLTYAHTVVIWVIVAVWTVVVRHRSALLDRRVTCMAGSAVILFTVLLLVIFRWAPVHLGLIFPEPSRLISVDHWTYYTKVLLHLVSPVILVLSAIGVLARRDRCQMEITYAGLWFLAVYLCLSVLVARDTRYGVLLLPAVVLLAVRGAIVAAERLVASYPIRVGPVPTALGILTLLMVVHVGRAPWVDVPAVGGFREVVAFLEQQPDNDRILYEGTYNGVFSFYLKAGDPTFQRGVVLAGKIIYASPDWGLHIKRIAQSPEEVLQVLKFGCGCRWVVIEELGYAAVDGNSPATEASDVLWQALSGPEFRLIKSFPIQTRTSKGIRVYRLLSPVERPAELELYVPERGSLKALKMKPLSAA